MLSWYIILFLIIKKYSQGKFAFKKKYYDRTEKVLEAQCNMMTKINFAFYSAGMVKTL